MNLRESKQSTIAKCVNLTQEQKDTLLTFFNGKGQSLWGKVDWNKARTLQWDDFQELLNTVTKSAKKRKGKLVEGKDYFEVGSTDEYDIYLVTSYEASVAMASNQWEPKVWTEVPSWYMDDPVQDYEPSDDPHLWGGAKWCIAMRHTRRYWDDYHMDTYGKGYDFIFLLHKSKPYKYALTMRGSHIQSIWNEKDELIDDNSSYQYFKGILEPFYDKLMGIYKKLYGVHAEGGIASEIAKEFGDDAVEAYAIIFGNYPTDYEYFKEIYRGWYQRNDQFFRSFLVAHYGTLNGFLKSTVFSYGAIKKGEFEDFIVENGDTFFNWDKYEKDAFLDRVKWNMDEISITSPVSVAWTIINDFNGKYIDKLPQSVLWDYISYDYLMTYFDVKEYNHYYFVKSELIENDDDFFEL